MSDQVVVSVGTKKGLFVFKSKRERAKWQMSGPFIKGWQVYHAIVDARRTPTVHAAASNETFATTTMRADLKKLKFIGAKKQPVPPKLTTKQINESKKWGISHTHRVWHIEPGGHSEKNVLYAGTAPAGLFRSEDGGKTWDEVKGLTNHPTRKHWQPGFGGMCLHSIQIDPMNASRMYVAISSAGAFRTDDGGRTWKSINKAVAKFVGAPKNKEVGT